MFYISEMTNTDHISHRRTGCIKHRISKVILSCPWSIIIAWSFYLIKCLVHMPWQVVTKHPWNKCYALRSTETFKKISAISVSSFYDDSAVSVGSAIGHTLLPNKKWIDIKIVNELRVKLHVMILKENFCANFDLIKHRFCSTHLV